MNNNDLIELLENQGVSNQLAKEVAAYSPNSRFTLFYLLSTMSIFLVVMVAGVLFGSWVLFSSSTVFKKAAEAEAILYNNQFAVSFIILLFGWIFCAAIVVAFLMKFTPLNIKAPAFIQAITWSGFDGPFARGRLMHSLREHPNPSSANELINNWGLRYITAVSKVALPILLIGMALYLLERDSWAYINEDGYSENSVNPFMSTITISWDELEAVELGCNHTGDSNFIIYEISGSSRSARLSSFQTTNGRNKIDTLIEVDSYIRNSGNAEFKRWQWLSRDPLHPKCLHYFRNELGEENYSPLFSLLRVGEFPED